MNQSSTWNRDNNEANETTGKAMNKKAVMRVRALVNGLVQGVCYRASTKDKADSLGVTGYVMNLADGKVEFLAEGEPGAVDALLEWAKQGPPFAQVESVSVKALNLSLIHISEPTRPY